MHQHEILPLEDVGTTGDSPDVARHDEGTHQARAADSPADRVSTQWQAIQGKFVDDPRGSVADARVLVDDLIQHVMRSVTERRVALDRQWSSEPTVSTEQLRLCLQQYRALFTQLFPVVSPSHLPYTRPQR